MTYINNIVLAKGNEIIFEIKIYANLCNANQINCFNIFIFEKI